MPSKSGTRQRSSSGRLGSLVVLAVALSAIALVILNGQLITDSINYHRYEPTNQIAAFAQETGMNDKGKFLFYASHPSLDDASSFNVACARTEATTAVLGCYNGQKIFIYDITDERLAGIRATTAAHEMLHAAYARLNEGDRSEVNQMLEDEFERLKTDSNLADRMAFYERTEPGERHNELHSVIGVEVGSLNPELEAYYKRYFSDRSKVVALHQQYSAVFDTLKARAAELNKQLEALGESIRANSDAYNAETRATQRAIQDFNSRANRGDFSSQSEFSSERQRLVARVTALEGARANINADVERYNTLVAELNSIATETSELNRSLDSTLAPPPSL